MSDVIVLVCDDKYVPHVKSVLANCRKQGQWEGDVCVIMPEGACATELEGRGFPIFRAPMDRHYAKYLLFEPAFQKHWGRILYLDCDVIVQKPLGPVFDRLDPEENFVLADIEPWDLMHAFTNWAPTEALKENMDIWRWLWGRYDPNYLQFNTGVLLWNSAWMPEHIYEFTMNIHKRLEPINTHVVNGTDQPAINLAMYGRFAAVSNKLFCYYAFADDRTVIVHYCSGYAPWIDKTDDMAAYANRTLGRPCHDIYKENLALFETLFPKG